jgi:hypothetical protein
MEKNPTYQEPEEKVKELEKEATERRKAEKALRENGVRLKVVLDTIEAPGSKLQGKCSLLQFKPALWSLTRKTIPSLVLMLLPGRCLVLRENKFWAACAMNTSALQKKVSVQSRTLNRI